MRLFAHSNYVPFLIGFSLMVIAGSVTGSAAEEKKAAAKAPAKITYDEHVKPIFRSKCFSCHNTDKKSGDLDLSNYISLMAGGGSGTSVEPGSAEDSYLFSLITHEAEPFMPPKQDKLDKDTLAVIRGWIDGGALENAGSKARVSTKPKFDFSLKEAPTAKPAVPPMPERLPLEPLTRTKLTTAITALATSPWAPLAAVAGQKQVLLYNTATLELLGVLPFPEGTPYVLRFSRNGSLLLAGGGRGGERGLAVVWNVKTGERLFEVGDELDACLAADISADQTMIALGGPQRMVRVYSTKDGSLLYEMKKHTNWVTSIAFSPDGVLLATGDRNGGVFVWEAYTGREYLSLRGHGGTINGFSWRPDSNLLASASKDTTIRLWEMENGRQIKSFGAHGGGVESVEFTRDARIVSCGRDRVTKLWDQSGKQLRAFEAFGDLALRVTYCDETNRVISGDWKGTIRAWNSADGKRVGEISPNPPKLAERLTAATQLHAAKQAEHTKLAAATAAAQAAATKMKTDLDATSKTVTETQKKSQTVTAAVAAGKKAATQLTAERDAAAKTVATLDPVLPLLKESTAKAQQAAAKATGDKELAALTAAIKSQLDKKTATHTAAKKTAGEKTAALQKTQQQLTADEKQVKDLAAALVASQKRVTDLTAALKPLTEKTTVAKKASDAAATAQTAAQQQIARWKDEIAFVQKTQELSSLQQKADELALVAEEANGKLNSAKTTLAAVTQAVANAQKGAEVQNAALIQAKQAADKVNGEREAVAKTIALLEGALPLLKEAADKGALAASKAAGDKEVAAAAASLKSLLAKKTAEQAASKKTLTEKTAQLEKSKAGVVVAEKTAKAAAAVLEAEKKKVAVATAAVKAADGETVKAKQAADAALQAADAIRKIVTGLKNAHAEPRFPALAARREPRPPIFQQAANRG